MIRCVYTVQKHKKLKTWIDGFVEHKGKRLYLYNSDMERIDSMLAPALDNEMETYKYLVYIDSFEDVEEDEAKDQDPTPDISELSKKEAGDEHKEEPLLPRGRSGEEIIGLFGK
ncbi:hypothetical protein EHEL_090510 [Encephalitozoon hellem ATCC 50504]|uniref:DUF2439 domain-containing protein n=1 Tax=Encephalitozoon hellem TaxID=27973 RepID=A0A9Q9FC74_ENCHE|nr:uncharacterized protein EHEL_090510 [Encephalitozoon hellem ATCC 50504]AFM98946.1 hypothetical protein EHEL_090510 [Encephalitozoon hellem ATCC 50504]UTX43960.1 DUF2439 domain-containing protein [Encephalitozoon hellem]|eukprot:XP_003887927.1 hypothetical protein EHEL_090510 [Encephalitozoon hellem ATCC 50504]